MNKKFVPLDIFALDLTEAACEFVNMKCTVSFRKVVLSQGAIK